MGGYQVNPPDVPFGVCHDDTRLTEKECDNQDPLLDAIADPILGPELFGGRLDDVPGLSGPGRHGVRPADGEYGPTLNDALAQRLGALGPDDYYFGVGPTGGLAPFTDKTLVPPAFVDNLRYVRTFITNATYDALIAPPNIAPALVAYGVPATFDRAPRRGVARPGWIYATLPGGTAATIRMPTYAAGHAVSATQAMELRADLAAWLGP